MEPGCRDNRYRWLLGLRDASCSYFRGETAIQRPKGAIEKIFKTTALNHSATPPMCLEAIPKPL